MKRIGFVSLVALSVVAPGPAAGQGTDELAAEVRAAERAFASSMAERDIEAFASHIADEAVFFTGKVLRGVAAIKEAWSPFFEGESAPFSWEPESVQVLDSGTLALSSGPVLDPEGNRIGTFNSVWRLEPDGEWKVVFDKGCDS
ncbi:MAG: DUF4440 domain-containing protein [Candidatus Palauibacterales bacterium]|jgi:uncharacterized protein (TIGR02246 family)|nr:DUF4440 domain-containing protein [Candidatus Palauibacterales bacterium]MDP2483606.1 DUF4440 domain-containing protein [Candidatus Palauibacterales bacterium]